MWGDSKSIRWKVSSKSPALLILITSINGDAVGQLSILSSTTTLSYGSAGQEPRPQIWDECEAHPFWWKLTGWTGLWSVIRGHLKSLPLCPLFTALWTGRTHALAFCINIPMILRGREGIGRAFICWVCECLWYPRPQTRVRMFS